MEVNGVTQNSDKKDFFENQTFVLNNDQTNVLTSNEMQSVGGNRTSFLRNSLSNVNNNTSNSETNVRTALNESSLFDTDALTIQGFKLLKKTNIKPTSLSAKGSINNANNDNNDNDSAIGGSFLKNLFEINGPASRSINELLKEYPYLPYYSLFLLLTASTGRESIERMLEWIRHLQAKQVIDTEKAIKEKEHNTELQFSNAYDSEDEYQQLSARAGISSSGSATQITKTLSKCERALIIVVSVIAVVVVCVITAGAGAGVAGVVMAGVITAVALAGIGMAVSAIVSAACKNPSTKAKVKEVCDLLNPVNAVAEIVVLIAEIFTDDEEKLKWVRLIARLIFTIIFIALTIWSGVSVAGAAKEIAQTIFAISGVVSGIVQIANGALTLSTLEKQRNVAKRRLELETAIAYCEKLQKDLDIIASEIDMIVEFFTAAMDKIRAEYDRISRMIKETSDVKNMIARNIGA